ncbi:MAG: PEP-CTERM sorting domain-containing protein, partial [Verrucomicrobiales bacterium]|nr:PEP-CTERM sorting domain-containing protein [Verrucomicrobiales bacterium]
FTVESPEEGWYFTGDVFSITDLNFSPVGDVVSFSLLNTISNNVVASNLQTSYTAGTNSYDVSFQIDGEVDDFLVDSTWQLNFTQVPEPSRALLLGLGAIGLVARRKRTA